MGLYIEKYKIDYTKLNVGDKLWSIQLGDCTMRGIGLTAKLERMIVCDNTDGLEVSYTEEGFHSKKDAFPSLFTSNPFADGEKESIENNNDEGIPDWVLNPAGDPYRELKEAYAAGKVIQYCERFTWKDIHNPQFDDIPKKYRIKLEDRPGFDGGIPTPGCVFGDKEKVFTEKDSERGKQLINERTEKLHNAANANRNAVHSAIDGEHESILQEAERLINGDRREAYGDAHENFTNISIGWEVIFRDGVTAEKVALAMTWLKICRFLNKASRDSIVDIAGYAGCLDKIMKGGGE